MTTQEIIYYFLSRDYRTSLWQLNSDDCGSIAHYNVIHHPNCDYKEQMAKQWEEDNQLFRQNFGIDVSERIIFHRDNTFFSSAHDQGLVITDLKVYYIPDNDYPNNRYYFSWALVESVDFDGENLNFKFTDGDLFPIPIKFFTKKSEVFWNPAIEEIGYNLASLFTSMASIINE